MRLTHKLTALIADDSSLIRDRLVELLSAFEGIDTIELATDTSEAKEKYQVKSRYCDTGYTNAWRRWL